MSLLTRSKLTIMPLFLYWLGIFVLTHIPIPPALRNVGIPDKTPHFVAYLILACLLWFAISPDKKANWGKARVWWALLIMVAYAAFDEWLQGRVGRSPDITDFVADMAGTLTALILLSLFPFWPTILALTGFAIFVLTGFIRLNIADRLPAAGAAFHLFAYGFFSLIWIQYAWRLLAVRPPQPKWLAAALTMPVGFLFGVELFYAVAGNCFSLRDIIISLAGIITVVATTWAGGLFARSTAKKTPANNS